MKKYILFCISLLLLTSCGENTQIPSEQTNSSGVILAIGDSLTIGYGLPENDSYPSQLEKHLQENGYNYIVQNAGISGDTSAGLLSRIDWMLEGDTSPSLAILCIGANDAFQGKNVDDIEKNIRGIIEALQSKKIPVLLAGMKAPFNLGKAYRDDYDELFPRLAKEYNLIFMPFLLEGVAMNPELNQPDRIHPTREGYTVVVENIFSLLKDEQLIQK